MARFMVPSRGPGSRPALRAAAKYLLARALPLSRRAGERSRHRSRGPPRIRTSRRWIAAVAALAEAAGACAAEGGEGHDARRARGRRPGSFQVLIADETIHGLREGDEVAQLESRQGASHDIQTNIARAGVLGPTRLLGALRDGPRRADTHRAAGGERDHRPD